MRTTITLLILGVAMSAGYTSTQANDAQGARGVTYDVSITNVTRGQSFTPFLVAGHRSADNLMYTAGAAPSENLAALAEGGDTDPLEQMLKDLDVVNDTAISAGLLDPGQTVTVSIRVRPGRGHISLAAMLLPSNDGFVSVQNVAVPRGRYPKTVYAPAYDAGSEPNDELCISIPGPVCGGAGGSPDAGGEGFVHIHGGIHGIGDLVAAERDWRNPVAQIVIQRVDD